MTLEPRAYRGRRQRRKETKAGKKKMIKGNNGEMGVWACGNEGEWWSYTSNIQTQQYCKHEIYAEGRLFEGWR